MTRIDIAPLTMFSPPGERTAPSPAEARGMRRDDVRLLVAHGDRVTHARFGDLADHLEPGDLVVVNASQTVAGELDAVLSGVGASTGDVVVHVATDLRDGTWVVEVRTAPDAAWAVLDAAAGQTLVLAAPGAELTLLEPYPRESSSPTGHGNRLWRASYAGQAALPDVLASLGRPIAYGYLDRRYPIEDYRTIFGTTPGSAEMPSAARPFTPDVVTRLVSRGIAIAPILLHTGVSSQEAGEAPQPEWFEVSEPAARLVNATRAGGGRVIAVGTTVTRALESAVRGAPGRAVVEASSGWTERVITRDAPPRVVDGLITGWHDPAASHLLLVEAVAGPRLTQRAYDAAVEAGYHWHEFGDSALLLPARAEALAA
ncbi:queuosine biosynthesis protein [Aeromicrobium sp. Root344]|uniref:S-adenosylmethionine:tRNA ribosyltransferase-isomerase n=1 Tax=Aeromicrobium sp. Root344 TaxID=1736521 RepID=UPI0006FFB65D|nr:S-adenosylmethionine:tRNA ribosyltransferase-isomerase [Aeromicrobium sp. Root344]KQV73672.1 queuosine biosynthesis protein [Aeromicrobium sp. Root344]